MNRIDWKDQGDLFAHAAKARDMALARVESSADPEWADRALEAVRVTALAAPEFISDDVWATAGLEIPKNARALGPIFRKAALIGWIKKTDRMRPSVRSHLSGKPVWSSLIYRAP